MSEEQLKAFLEKIKGDTSLQEKLKAASDADAVAEIAKEAGFSISADDLKNAQSEVSEEELEDVAGGTCQPLISAFRWAEANAMAAATGGMLGNAIFKLPIDCKRQ